jgi:hypothetical protein
VRRSLPLAALVLPLLLAVPPARAEQRLEARPACDGVSVTGTEFPERVVLLMVADLRSGKVLAGPVATPTRPDGSFRATVRADLAGRGTVEVTAWRKSGATVIMTAKDLVERPCVEAASQLAGTLPATGGHGPALLSLGLGLLALGALLRHAPRHRGRHEPGAAQPARRIAASRARQVGWVRSSAARPRGGAAASSPGTNSSSTATRPAP